MREFLPRILLVGTAIQLIPYIPFGLYRISKMYTEDKKCVLMQLYPYKIYLLIFYKRYLF